MSEKFRKYERIHKSHEIQTVLRQIGLNGTVLVLYSRKSDRPYSRFAVIASRKVGNAVVRNRAKRWLREVFRRIKNRFLVPVDLVVRVKPAIQEISFYAIQTDFLDLLMRKRLFPDH